MNKLMTVLALASLSLCVHAAEPAPRAKAATKPAAVQPADAAAPARARKPPSAKQLAQQQKMKNCNAQAKGKSGDERKAFMKTCLRA